MDRRVQPGRARGRLATLRAVGGERDVLHDPRAQRGHVLGVDRVEPVRPKAAGRLVRRAGPGQREHGAVLQPEIIRVLVERALGEVERGEQLAAPLGVANVFGPFRGRMHGHRRRPYLRPTAPVKESRRYGRDVPRLADAG